MTTTAKIIHWTPRVLCIVAILFISMFAADSFSSERTFFQNLGALMMHLIPSFMLVAFLIFAWKYEFLGGILFILLGLGFSFFIYNLNFDRTQSVSTALQATVMLTVPFVVVGILFIVSHHLKRRQ
ncbi:MAG: hypothetical protein MUC78_12310 [Bacteroidales bacterium]|jgi:hypothetical protein|nr:hypothetical protein [Bacteroidales bacterium]